MLSERQIWTILKLNCEPISDEAPGWVVNGIPMQRAGSNSSHSFYLGTKGGKLYSWAYGEEGDENYPPSEVKSHEDIGYLGNRMW